MGGSGKTTIAKAIYNRIYREFIGKSFIENISDVWNPQGERYVALQENLLYDVTKFKVLVKSIGMGRTMIENGLSGKKLFIVFDDVEEFGELENLCGSREWFGQGTLLIITTRDVRLLNQLKVNYVYKMDVINENDSFELFSWHAFREGKPRKDLNELARNVAAYCGGLPLALEVLGSFLCGKTMEEWESELSKLKIIPIDQIQEKLKISFDGLHDTEKDIFLDVCRFYIDIERCHVTEMLNECGLHGDNIITVLIERGLIKVDRNNTLGVHPLLRDMGREILCQKDRKKPRKWSRLWFKKNMY